IREGQYLLIPVTYAGEERVIEPATTTPGTGSPTPTPPSASKPLPPADTTAAATKPAETTTAAKPAEPVADVGTTTTAPSASRPMQIPVQGSIIRDYAKGKNDGIDIAAPAGTAVKAAESGTVAAITTNTEGVPILVIKHSNNLLTVYTHIDGITVKKGDTVKRGETIGKVRAGDPARMHFEVRDGFDSVDPNDYI
ncbi:MAG: M23 family metallopeptidase, partial [Pseudomonadota bacterium]|nr:M23 family metallopeptidase [Pseudomonadota bacterium]